MRPETHSEEAIRAARGSGDKDAELYPMVLQALLAARQTDGQDAERMLMKVHSKRWGALPVDGISRMPWQIFMQAKNKQGWRICGIANPSTPSKTSGLRSRMKSLGCPFLPTAMYFIATTQTFLFRRRSRKKHCELLDIGRARTLEEGLGLAKEKPNARPDQAVDAQAVARKLDTTILFYSLGPKKSWLWAITPHHTHLFPLPAQSDIEAQVRSYQNAILKSSDPLREENQAARNLYETLVMPAAAMIPKGSKSSSFRMAF